MEAGAFRLEAMPRVLQMEQPVNLLNQTSLPRTSEEAGGRMGKPPNGVEPQAVEAVPMPPLEKALTRFGPEEPEVALVVSLPGTWMKQATQADRMVVTVPVVAGQQAPTLVALVARATPLLPRQETVVEAVAEARPRQAGLVGQAEHPLVQAEAAVGVRVQAAQVAQEHAARSVSGPS